MDRSSSSSVSSPGFRQAIRQVTDPAHSLEDWSLIMQICDDIAAQDDSAEEAMEEIRKRLQAKTFKEGWRSIALTLTLLEALVNNCGEMFHLQLADPRFLRALKGVIAPENKPPPPIEKRVLGMIQDWTVAYSDEPGLAPIRELYEVCQEEGFEFPARDEQHVMKVSRTRMTPPPPKKTVTRPKTAVGSYARSPHHNDSSSTAVIRHLPDEQIAKLRSELDLVHINLDVLEEMLANLEPGHEHPYDWQLLLDLYETCKRMQARIVSLLALVAIEDIAVDFLRCNDRLNRVFKNYKSHMDKRENNRQIRSHDDCDSDESDNQLVKSSTARRSIPITSHRCSVDEHGDDSRLPTIIQNIQVTPLPDPVPRSATQSTLTKRALSTTDSVEILRNRNKTAPILIEDEENTGSDDHVQKISRNDCRTDQRENTRAALPSRVKRLSSNPNGSSEGGYRITGYHNLESDSNN